MIATYPDSGVLIVAARGSSIESAAALEVLDDPNRRLISSAFVWLEVVPKATFYKRTDERTFYIEFFRRAEESKNGLSAVVSEAQIIAARFGLNAMDALHVASALAVGAEEFVTTENGKKPIFRVEGIRM